MKKKQVLIHVTTRMTLQRTMLIEKTQFHINRDTIKVLKENTGSKISDTPQSSMFTNMSPRARDINERINKWDFIKTKSFYMARESMGKMKKEPTM